MSRLLYLTSPPLHGPDVLDVQNHLRRHGVDPGPRDGVFGTATGKAVRRFQRRAGVHVDGVVGDATRRALGLEHVAPPESHPGREPPGWLALEWMRARVGMKEHPPNTNRCDVTREFGLVGPWCAMAVSLAFKHGANLILGDQTPPPWGFWPGRGFAYVPALEAWAKTRGFWLGRAAPRHGDIACYGFGAREPVHTGIVSRYLGGGQFEALEGNTGVGNDANGGELMLRHRYVSQAVGFARVSWRQP